MNSNYCWFDLYSPLFYSTLFLNQKETSRFLETVLTQTTPTTTCIVYINILLPREFFQQSPYKFVKSKEYNCGGLIASPKGRHENYV